MQIDMKLGFKGWCDSEASRIGDEPGTQVQGMTASWAERGAAPGDKAVSQAVPGLVLHHATRGMKRLSFPTRPCISHKAHPLHFSGCHIPTAPPKRRDYITVWSIAEHKIINKGCKWRGMSHGSLCSYLHRCILKITYFPLLIEIERQTKPRKTPLSALSCWNLFITSGYA